MIQHILYKNHIILSMQILQISIPITYVIVKRILYKIWNEYAVKYQICR